MSVPERAAARASSVQGRADRRRTIFINYRREDSGGQARALLYALERSFPDQVFMDVKGLEPGMNYLDEIERTVGSCRAVLVLIGRSWVDMKDGAGRRRLLDPRDVVTLEIATALQRKDVLVIPVLVAGATLPAEEDLPESLRDLVRRQCIHLTDQDWDYNVAQLVETLRRKLAVRSAAAGRRPLVLAGVAAAVLALAVAGVLVLRRSSGGTASPAERPLAAAVEAPRPAPPPPATAAPAVPPPASLASAEQPPAREGAAARPAEPKETAPAPARPPPPSRTDARKHAAREKTAPPPRPRAEERAAPPASDAPAASSPRTAAASPTAAQPGPTQREVFTSQEVLTFQQFFGDPANRERGRNLVKPARWTVDPAGGVTFAPGQPIAGFFPMSLHGTRTADRVTFDGVRTASSSAGLAYVRVSGHIATRASPPVVTVDIEFGRASGSDESAWEPTYRARARVRVSPQ